MIFKESIDMMKTLIIGICMIMTSLSIAAQNKPKELEQTVIILLGPPGSGKGTQAVRMTKELGIPHISTGDLFRENIGKGTELGKKAKTFIDAGNLVPDEVVLDMLFDRVSRPDCAKGFLLDGFPRTIPQAEAFDKRFAGKANLVVLNLNVSNEAIVKRAEGRLTCRNCGSVYNKYFSPPAKDGVCDKCGGELYQRPDDAPEVVKERLKVYHTQTKPLIAYYEKKGLLTTVDGEAAPDVVYGKLMNLYREKTKR